MEAPSIGLWSYECECGHDDCRYIFAGDLLPELCDDCKAPLGEALWFSALEEGSCRFCFDRPGSHVPGCRADYSAYAVASA